MKSMIKAIAVDMDGTFLDSKKQYDQERFNRIFQQLKNENIKFIAASGNQYAKLKSIFGDKAMFFVAENVDVIYEVYTLYDYKSFEKDVFHNIVNYLKNERCNNEIIVYGVKSAYILKKKAQSFKKDAHFYY